MHQNILIIFTKYPFPGQVKTRLISSIGAEKAADLHRQMTEKTVLMSKNFAEKEKKLFKIFYKGSDLEAMKNWLGDMSFERQKEGDLGEKMSKAFKNCFEGNAQKVVIIGTDCPALTSDILHDAFKALDRKEIVLGPAEDGGYYLVGLKRRADFLFKNISWGTNMVFSQTREKALQKGLHIATLKHLADVDRPDDLIKFDLFKEEE